MSVTYKDIDELTLKATLDGTEKFPVSDTQYATPEKIVIGGMVKTTLIPVETVSGKWIDTSGSIESQASMSYWKYSVTPGKTYLFGGRYGSNMSVAKFVSWFDRNFTFISQETYGANGTSTVSYTDQPVVAPANAAYLVLNIQNYYESSGYYHVKALGDIYPTKTSELVNDAPFLKYVLCVDETAYNAIQNKDSGTLYLIPES